MQKNISKEKSTIGKIEKKREERKERKLIIQERTKEQREGITRCESPSPRPSKQLSQVQCSF